MPSQMTFNSLQEDMRNYLERGFTAESDPIVYEQLPKLINLAERQLATELKVLGYQESVTSAFETGVCVYAKPDRWRETISMNFGTGTNNNTRNPIFARSYEYITSYWPDRTAVDAPEYYGDYDFNHFIVVPTPDADYPFEMMAWMLPALLDDTNQTNWSTEIIPQALLYGALLQATPFLKNDERLQVWTGMYDRAVAGINGEDLARIMDRAAQRTTS